MGRTHYDNVGYIQNQWNFALNVDNQSKKEDLVQALGVFGSAGFSARSFISYGGPEVWGAVNFDPDYFSDVATRDAALKAGLLTLVRLKGVSVWCAPNFQPSPALTIRN